MPRKRRILTDRISKFCFATEEDAVRQQFEGKHKNSIFYRMMVDNLFIN